MRDITDFSAKDSKAYNESVSLFEEAFGAADKDLLSFDEARRSRDAIPTTFTKKTHNSVHFLDEARTAKKKMSEKTNAVVELLEANKDKLKEELKLGATPEELEEEVRGDFGREILEICQAHGITRSAIWDAFEILKALIGEEPDVDEEVEKWGGSSGESDPVEADTDDTEDIDDSEDDEIEESVERFPRTIEEMTKVLRHKIAEKRIREKAQLGRKRKLRESDPDYPDPDEYADEYESEEERNWRRSAAANQLGRLNVSPAETTVLQLAIDYTKGYIGESGYRPTLGDELIATIKQHLNAGFYDEDEDPEAEEETARTLISSVEPEEIVRRARVVDPVGLQALESEFESKSRRRSY